MLLQISTPRINIDSLESPKYILVHTLCKKGISTGDVLFGAFAVGGQARHPKLEVDNKQALAIPQDTPAKAHFLEPQNVFLIRGEEGFQALEYVLPFWELFQEQYKNRNLILVPFCTSGFSVTARSAFRSNPQTYEERLFTFQIQMPVNGGGIVRLGDSLIDIKNSTFDPWAPNPRRPYNREFEIAYNRTHCLGDQKAINERREKRVKETEASMAAENSKTKGTLLLLEAETQTQALTTT